MKHAFIVLLLATVNVPAVKLIETGWDMPDTRGLRDNLAAMEQRPFDGVVIEAVGQRDDKKPCRLREAFSNERWDRDWFRDCLDDLQACKCRRFTDNFLLVGANPGNVDWSEDAGWGQVAAHWRIAARLAKQGGLKGILFDPEPYTEPYAQFRRAGQPEQNRNISLARQRGRDVMSAVAEEFPDITLFCYFANSVQPNEGYGLLPAFLDGWLDAAPASVTIVDGCESAYCYKTATQYLEAAVKMKGDCQRYVSPENRAKYRAQMQVSFGIYLDAYANPPTSPWHVPGKTEGLCANVTTAGRVADEYVWVYGEKSRWWPTPTWNEALPGSEAVLAFARDPLGYARDQIVRHVGAVALANDWKVWQEDESHGKFTWDTQAGSGRVAQAAHGCFIQSIAAKPGEHYAVQARCHSEGAGAACVLVRWQTADNKWTAEAQDVPLAAEKSGEIFGVVTVPETAGRLTVLLLVKGQHAAQDTAEFRDVRVFKLE
jgi:hypothetical protein